MMYFLLVVVLATAAAASDECPTTFVPDCTAWWGDGEPRDLNTTITPFEIEWPQEMIEDLVSRLENKRPLTPPLEDSGYNYGTNTDTMPYWLDYWQNDYNFTERLAFLNKYPQYTVYVQGIRVHFIHIKIEVPTATQSIPVLMLHGFTGSVREFYEAIEYIIAICKERGLPIELVVPSLPGFGYSGFTTKQGLGALEMACIFKNLMSILGHEQCYVQGGDIGSIIGAILATYFPNNILGYHSNMGFAFTDSAFGIIASASVYPAAIMRKDLISRLYPLEDTLKFIDQDFGYLHIQAAKPDTIGACLESSPTSLVAWFLNLFSIFASVAKSNETMGGADMYPLVKFFDNIMYYWAPGRITTAIRIYAETFNLRGYRTGFLNTPSSVPTVIVQTKREIIYMPEIPLKTKYPNLVAVDVLDSYGHFFALEAPKEFAELFLSGLERIIQYREGNNL